MDIVALGTFAFLKKRINTARKIASDVFADNITFVINDGEYWFTFRNEFSRNLEKSVVVRKNGNENVFESNDVFDYIELFDEIAKRQSQLMRGD